MCTDYHLYSQTSHISPGLRRIINDRINSGVYHSMILVVIDGQNEEFLVMNGPDEKLSPSSLIDVSGLYPLIVSLQFADMMDNGIHPKTPVNELLEKENRIKGKQSKGLMLSQLALNTSGLSDTKNSEDDRKVCQEEKMNQLNFSKRSFSFNPGSVYCQHNLDLIYLSNLLLAKYGLPCELYFNDNLFRNLNLSKTLIVDGLEIPGIEEFDEKGILVSNVKDLSCLMRIQLGQKKKKFHSSLQELRKYVKETRFDKSLVCPGWFVYQSDRAVFYYQQSERKKISVFMIFEPIQQKAIVIASKSEIPLDDIAWHMMMNENLQSVSASDIKNIKINKYVGEYSWNGEEVISILKEGNFLIAYFNGEESHICYPIGNNTFKIAVKGITFHFVLNENDVVDGLYLDGYSPKKFYRMN
ncbi:MAG: hypothetical protein H8E61_05660 [Bacteroidetes bacterium]|nr:hypothetical protein [Bacteroidota bacterium]